MVRLTQCLQRWNQNLGRPRELAGPESAEQDLEGPVLSFLGTETCGLDLYVDHVFQIFHSDALTFGPC